MRTKIFASAAVAVMILSVAGFAVLDTNSSSARKREAARIVGLLPASDGVAVFESKRFLTEALPRVLSANQSLLGNIMSKLAEMEAQTGIDIRKFDQVAVGVSVKATSSTKKDIEPLAIASGDINAGALLSVAKLASKGTYREEKIGSHTVYIFAAKDAAAKAAPAVANANIARSVTQAIDNFASEIAVTAYDANTLIIGSVGKVRETLQGNSHVSSDVTGLLTNKDTSIISFAFRAPGGMAKMVSVDNDELGRNIDSIHYVAGSLDVAAAGTSVQVMARTDKPEQAQSLKEMVDGLQLIGKAFLGNAKKADQQVLSRLLKNLTVSIHGTDVSLELMVPQSDIDVLVAGIK